MRLAASRGQDFTLRSCWLCLNSSMSSISCIELLGPQILIHCAAHVWDGDKGHLVQVFVTSDLSLPPVAH